MAGGTWLGIETARRGMSVHQKALDITGHNLANASTPGYSRQEAVIRPTDPYTNPSLNSSVTPGQFGTGSSVTMIRRVKDEYLDTNVRQATTNAGYWQDQVMVMKRVEASFAEPAEEGIAQRMVDFFKGWMDLNNTPQDVGTKAAVIQIGDALASLMSTTYRQLTDIENSAAKLDGASVTGGQLKGQVNTVNDLLLKIRNLTDSIEKIYQAGQQPNDLLDRRDSLLEELSRYGPVNATDEFVNGKPTGKLLALAFHGIDVLRPSANTFELVVASGEISLRAYGSIVPANNYNLTQNSTDSNQGGSLLGLERARNNIIRNKSMLQDIATNLQTEISRVLTAAGATPSDFFTGNLATGFRVNTALINNPSLLDGKAAGNIANIRQEKLAALAGSTVEEYYARLVTEVGGNARGTGDMAVNQEAILKQITGLRDSVSGVSTDEELTKMVQFQYGFQASARMINVMDGILDVIINRLF